MHDGWENLKHPQSLMEVEVGHQQEEALQVEVVEEHDTQVKEEEEEEEAEVGVLAPQVGVLAPQVLALGVEPQTARPVQHGQGTDQHVQLQTVKAGRKNNKCEHRRIQ